MDNTPNKIREKEGSTKMSEKEFSLKEHSVRKLELCGYSNCFRPFYKMRGFMPCCKFHYEHPLKWGKDGQTFTGSVFVKFLKRQNHD